MKVSKRLNLSIENDEDVDNENITLKKFDSKVKKKPVQTWEIIDLFNVLDRTPADRIAKYLNDSDPMAHYTYNDNKWRLFASLSDEKTKRMSAENWRTYGNTMLRNPEIDNNNYWFRSALYRARELFKTIGCEKEAHEINIKLALNPAPDISIAEFSDVEKSLKKGPDDLKLRITLEKVKRLIKDKEYFEAFELLVQCKDQVLNLDDIEITLFYDGLVIGVLSYIQIYGSYVREFEKKWGWNNWLESFIESSRRYLFNDTCGVKGKFDRQSIIAATARLLLHVYGKDASKFIENNEEYYISNSENDLYRYLKHCEKSGITREIFENFKNES
jgi:hypothetical protein